MDYLTLGQTLAYPLSVRGTVFGVRAAFEVRTVTSFVHAAPIIDIPNTIFTIDDADNDMENVLK